MTSPDTHASQQRGEFTKRTRISYTSTCSKSLTDTILTNKVKSNIKATRCLTTLRLKRRGREAGPSLTSQYLKNDERSQLRE